MSCRLLVVAVEVASRLLVEVSSRLLVVAVEVASILLVEVSGRLLVLELEVSRRPSGFSSRSLICAYIF